jgi:uncharacterized protein YjbI with pentapeptide repeats
MPRKRSTLAFIALTLVVLGLLAFAIFNPRWVLERSEGADALSGMTKNEILKAENDVRTTLIQALGAAFFLVTALLAWKGYRLNREGQITERFSRAVDQLGKENEDSIKVGAILSLDRVAHESKGDRATIVNLLAVHIRSSMRGPNSNRANRGHASTRRLRRELTPDAKMSFVALARIHRLGIPDLIPGLEEERHQYADLRGIVLRGADLRREYVVDVDLSESDLSDAILEHANLQGVNLYAATLRNANLCWVNTGLKKPRGITLRKADLRGAMLKGARLDQSILRGAMLGTTGSRPANLGGAVLKSVRADGVWLEGVELSGADLRNGNFSNAHCKRVNLIGADLRGANFTHATDLETARLTGAKVSDRTQPPYVGFNWVQFGAIYS